MDTITIYCHTNGNSETHDGVECMWRDGDGIHIETADETHTYDQSHWFITEVN